MSLRLTIFGLLIAASLHAQPASTLSWQDCLAEAAKYHPDLVVASSNVSQAKSTIQIAQGNQLPSVTANATVGRSKNNGFPSTNFSSAGVNASFTAFDGGALAAATGQAKAQLQSTKQAYKVTSAQLRFNLRSSFIGLWRAQQTIAIAQSILRIRQSSYDLISLRYKSGIEHLGAFKSAAAKLSQAQAGVVAAQRDLLAAQTALCKAIGYPMTRELKTENIPLPVLPATQPNLDALSKEHPSYLQALAGEKVAQQGVKGAQAAYWPTLSLSASAGRGSNDMEFGQNNDSVSASVSYTLFNGFARSATLQKARSGLVGAQASSQSAYNSLYSSLKSAWSGFADAIDTANVEKNFLDADTEREKIAQAQYNVGLTTYDNWTIIEDNLVSTENANLNAQAGALNAQANWELAQGVVIDEG